MTHDPRKDAKNFVHKFLQMETAGGFLLMAALFLALFAANSFLQPYYEMLLSTRIEIRVSKLEISKSLLHWVNDALMAVFFFLVGLELKREVLVGQLSSMSSIILPALAAAAGIAVPALIYSAINAGDPIAMRGWAIPTATDIAFALGVLALLGDRVPAELKLFLLAVAIIDDIGAIVIIAIFYSADLSGTMFGLAGAAIVVLAILNRIGVKTLSPYIFVGIVLWIAVLKSGIHATLAGIVLAMFIPLKSDNGEKSLLERLEHDLHHTVAFIILPVFAFMNAGINLTGLKISDLLAPAPLGIALGLLVGKQLGIFGIIWLSVKTGIAKLPNNVGWLQIYGLSVLCGIGFTMSLFISSLAFDQSGSAVELNERLGIIVGSMISAVLGYFILRVFSKPKVPQ